MKITRHLTEEGLIDLIFEKLNVANPNVDKLVEFADKLDLIFDQEKEMYLNPKWLDPEEFLTEKCKNYTRTAIDGKIRIGFWECISFIDEYHSRFE